MNMSLEGVVRLNTAILRTELSVNDYIIPYAIHARLSSDRKNISISITEELNSESKPHIAFKYHFDEHNGWQFLQKSVPAWIVFASLQLNFFGSDSRIQLFGHNLNQQVGRLLSQNNNKTREGTNLPEYDPLLTAGLLALSLDLKHFHTG